MPFHSLRLPAMILAVAIYSTALAAPPVTLENVVAPAPNLPDEPIAGQFSLDNAIQFLDSAALDWQKSRRCFTCHTNYAYLMARPSVSADAVAHRQVRAYAEELITERWPSAGPRWDAEVVATGVVLAINDRFTTGRLHPLTKQALDRMWSVQQEDGGWDWLKCDWPPMESDDHYGVTFAAIGVGLAPDDYRNSPAARAGLEKIREYLRANPPPTLHHRAMVLWASTVVDGLLTDAERGETIERLRAAQQPDGGWGLATLGDWKRADGSAQDTTTSDGYGTGFVIYVLRQAGVPAHDAAVERGVAWLKTNQRASGRWFTRSLHTDNKHFISHAGTAYAVMALAACESIE